MFAGATRLRNVSRSVVFSPSAFVPAAPTSVPLKPNANAQHAYLENVSSRRLTRRTSGPSLGSPQIQSLSAWTAT